RSGFTAVAFEKGDGQAAAVNLWLAGNGDESDLSQVAGVHTIGVFGELLRELRRINRGRQDPVQIIGIDLPNTLTLRPDLEPVADYLRAVDPDIADLVDGVLRTADGITGESAVVSATHWGGLDPSRRESLTADLARLSLRLRALEPLYVARSDQRRYDVARRHLDAASHTDYALRSMNAFFSGTGLPDDTSIRDHFIARCVQWDLERLATDARMVLVAHNNHIQKTLVTYEGYPTALPAGHRSGGSGSEPHEIAERQTMDIPVAEAFDAVLATPTATMASLE
ncbi:erythromycin esterase family protein, partial [Actinomadura welshii]